MARGPAPAGLNAGQGPSQAAPLAVDVPRHVVSMATFRVEVSDGGAATAQAGCLAVEARGFVSGSEGATGPTTGARR